MCVCVIVIGFKCIRIYAWGYTLVYNPHLRTRMKNCSGAIDVSLGYKTNKDISSIRTFEGTKIFFSCSFHDIGYAKFLITLLLYI